MLSMNAVKSKASSLKVASPSPDRTSLIRQIQAAEGNSPCYRTKNVCEQTKCCWREECIRSARMPAINAV
jgi:hypothetical protein